MSSQAAELVGRDVELGHLLSLVQSTQGGAARMLLLTGAAGTGKSALMRHVLSELSTTEYKPRAIVAQSSALMKDCAPLYTAKQWLKRWQGENMTLGQMVQRVLQDAGLSGGDDDVLERAVGALLGSGAAVQVPAQVEALARVLLGMSRGRRGLALTVEDAEVRPPRSPSAPVPRLAAGRCHPRLCAARA